MSSFEEIEHELLNALGAGRFRYGGIASLGQARRKEGDQSYDHGEDYGGGGNGASMAADKLPDAVLQRVGAGLQGLTVQVMVNVTDQGFNRTVASQRIFVHRA
jgi:hypothetical protein